MARLFCGVGFNTKGKYSIKEDGKSSRCYTVWRNMIKRCYSEAEQKRVPTYIGCTVSDEWHDFQNFAEWYTNHDYYGLGYDVDKDLLVRGNKVYSKETCSLVPPRINTLLTNLSGTRSKRLTGVTYIENKGLFQARIRSSGLMRNLGFFETEAQAHQAYIKSKEKLVKMAALEHRYDMDEAVFNALMGWRFYE